MKGIEVPDLISDDWVCDVAVILLLLLFIIISVENFHFCVCIINELCFSVARTPKFMSTQY
jgi:hypothetical protein